jgi:hypothetical protein
MIFIICTAVHSVEEVLFLEYLVSHRLVGIELELSWIVIFCSERIMGSEY